MYNDKQKKGRGKDRQNIEETGKNAAKKTNKQKAPHTTKTPSKNKIVCIILQ